MAISTPQWLRVSTADAIRAAGFAALVAVFALSNVVGAKYHRRVDVTSDRRFSLSPATLDTLHALGDPVEIHVLLGEVDPLRRGLEQLLRAYRDESDRVTVDFVDPDRDSVRLAGLRQRFRIEAGRAEDGRVVTDAVIVVARAERHWFLGASDLVSVRGDDGGRVEPREEQAITRALREVTGGRKPRVCFTEGHGEMSPDDGSERGVAHLRDLLEKENFEVAVVELSAPGRSAPLEGCDVALLAGPRGPFSADEVNRLRTYLLEGGSAAVFASPTAGDGAAGILPLGLEPALSPFGVRLGDALVVEVEAARVLPDSGGVRFFADPRPHPVTAALTTSQPGAEAPRVALQVARPVLRVDGADSAAPIELLASSDGAYGLASLAGSSTWKELPKPSRTDFTGPFALAMAAERPKLTPDAPHGPRVVVVGTHSVLAQDSFLAPMATRGSALLVESVVSWLTARPLLLDIPPRAAERPSLALTEASREEIRRYVVFWMPAAAILLGLAVAFRRRSTEVRKERRAAASKGPSR